MPLMALAQPGFLDIEQEGVCTNLKSIHRMCG